MRNYGIVYWFLVLGLLGPVSALTIIGHFSAWITGLLYPYAILGALLLMIGVAVAKLRPNKHEAIRLVIYFAAAIPVSAIIIIFVIMLLAAVGIAGGIAAGD